jgi:hypothetical protein
VQASYTFQKGLTNGNQRQHGLPCPSAPIMMRAETKRTYVEISLRRAAQGRVPCADVSQRADQWGFEYAPAVLPGTGAELGDLPTGL